MRRAILLLALLGGCDRCSSCKDTVKAHLTDPPIEDHRKEVERQVATSARQATFLCGFPVTGLKDAKVTVESESPRRFKVEGKPIPKNPDAGPVVTADGGRFDQRSVALCVGIVSLVAFAQVDKDNKVTGFKYEAFDVESVSTPGVTYVKPKSGGGWD